MNELTWPRSIAGPIGGEAEAEAEGRPEPDAWEDLSVELASVAGDVRGAVFRLEALAATDSPAGARSLEILRGVILRLTAMSVDARELSETAE